MLETENIKTKWSKVRLGEFAKVISGYAFKSKDFKETGIPIIKIANIRDGYIDLSDCQYVEDSFLNIDKKFIIGPEEILISLTGSHLSQPNSVVGRVAKSSKSFQKALLNQRAGKIIIKNSSACNLNYLFYVLSQFETKKQIAMMAHGAASQANVSPNQIESLEINLPPFQTQQKIASILSAYDDLIENNTRRIAILEAMAQALYREWFVHFRYPDHGEVPLVDSPLGPIPQGWEVKRLGDLTEVITKGTTPTTIGKSFVAEGINFLKVESISNVGSILQDKTAKIDGETHSLLKRSQLKPQDILFSIAGAIGRVTIISSENLPANVNQALAIIRLSNLQNISYVYFHIRSQEFLNYSLGRVVQTAQANVSLSVLSSAPILLPETSVLHHFNGVVEPILKNIFRLTLKNEKLRQTRDLLLPRLISGQLDVSELEIEPV